MLRKETETMVYKPKNKYSWGDGFAPKLDANIVGGVVEQIEAERGSVTKEAFLDVSRPEDAPTHCLFEWDDSKAAEKYRLDQARNTIGNLRIVYVSSNKEKVPIRAFVNVSAKAEKSMYESISVALLDESKRKNILNRIQGELDAFIQRNNNIEELADMLIAAGEKLKEGRKSA